MSHRVENGEGLLSAKRKDQAFRLLILGGTTEANLLARALADRSDVAPLLCLAGRTANPCLPPIPCRIGGFGGADGLAAFLRAEAIDGAIDATHPFARRISANAVSACRQAGVPLAAYTRPPWTAVVGDNWYCVDEIDAAVRVLDSLGQEDEPAQADAIPNRKPHPRAEERADPLFCDEQRGIALTSAALSKRLASRNPKRAPLGMGRGRGGRFRVLLTTGRLDLTRFHAAPQHDYIVRTIDRPGPSDIPPNATVLLARPPFTIDDETALMRDHLIDVLVTKNSGGTASAAKLAAARALGVSVLMVNRPPPSDAEALQSLDAVLAWIATRCARHADG